MEKGKDLLLIFTRNPELGKCKTRLAATIGEPAALEIYKFLLRHTAAVTGPLETDKWVWYSNEIPADDLWARGPFVRKQQSGKDLGDRMKHAFKEAFTAGYERVVIIGSDLYDISTSDLSIAFQALEEKEFVIGPAADGGYYLLGMTSYTPEVFEKMEWGTDSVLAATIAALRGRNLHRLPIRNDIDVYEDIRDNKAFAPFLKHLNNDSTTT